MSMRAEIFEQPFLWRGPLAVSAFLHVGLVVFGMALGMWASHSDNNWGIGGPASEEHVTNAKLVASAIPLPARESDPESVLATESTGKSVSQPKPPEDAPDAIALPDRPSHMKPDKVPHTMTAQKPAPNQTVSKDVVPFGAAPPAAVPYSTFRAASGTGGMTFGQSGSFAERYAWYVSGVQRKISENWMKYEVDPSLRDAPRVYLTFEIQRDGSPANVTISQSSGVPSLDVSAVRALKRIDTFGPLPQDYTSSRVSVEFWFEFKR